MPFYALVEMDSAPEPPRRTSHGSFSDTGNTHQYYFKILTKFNLITQFNSEITFPLTLTLPKTARSKPHESRHAQLFISIFSVRIKKKQWPLFVTIRLNLFSDRR